LQKEIENILEFYTQIQVATLKIKLCRMTWKKNSKIMKILNSVGKTNFFLASCPSTFGEL